MPPNSPQAALRLHNVVLGLLVVVVLLELAVLVLAFLLGRHVNWWHFPVVPVGLVSLVVLTPAAIWLAVTARRDLAAHILPGDEHWCQCCQCGRTVVASQKPPAAPRGRPGMTPQERIRSASALLVTLPVLLVLSVLALVISLRRGTDSTFPVLTVVNLGLLALLALAASALIAVMVTRRARARAELGELGVDHGCTCRWCHALGTPVPGGVPRAGAPRHTGS